MLASYADNRDIMLVSTYDCWVQQRMLTERAVSFLKPLVFDAQAERYICMIPFSGIYWKDEIPGFQVLMGLYEVEICRFQCH